MPFSSRYGPLNPAVVRRPSPVYGQERVWATEPREGPLAQGTKIGRVRSGSRPCTGNAGTQDLQSIDSVVAAALGSDRRANGASRSLRVFIRKQ